MSDALRILRQPRWLVMLILLPMAMALCVVAANWQYQRHIGRSQQEAALAASRDLPPTPLASVQSPGQPLPATDRYTLVSVTGTYEPEPVLIRNRPLNAERGMWVTNALRAADGTTVMVLRGWLAATPDNVTAPVVPAAPNGTVTVTGALLPSEPRRGPGLLSNGEATALDTELLCQDPQCYRSYIQLTSSDPADSLEPVPVRGPGLGPHLGYAGQWIIFMILLPIGFVVLLRRQIRDDAHARVSQAQSD